MIKLFNQYLLACVCLLSPLHAWGQKSLETHPLMPGVRSEELHNKSWPRHLHDKLTTGFSPLNCNMQTAPNIWSTIELGGQTRWAHLLQDETHGERVLVYDGSLRLINPVGEVVWTASNSGQVVYYGDLRGEVSGPPQYSLLLSAGDRLILLDATNGKTKWMHQFGFPHSGVRARVADLIPDKPGLEAALFLSHSEEGYLINFPAEGEPEFVWHRKVVIPGEYDELFDHGCDIKLDLSDPEQPLIWNVRRFRCRGFDARTGEMVSSVAYDIGGAQRRNYGPWDFGKGKEGQPLICVVGENVQTHVHAIRLNRDAPNELAWEHYYGEVHKESPGVVLTKLAIADLDQDGETEIAYTVRDHAKGLRTYVRVRDATTGKIEHELPDHWGVAALTGLGTDQSNVLLAYSDPQGQMPTQGDLKLFTFSKSGELLPAGIIPEARLWSPQTINNQKKANEQKKTELLIRELDEQREPRWATYVIQQGKLIKTASTTTPALIESSAHAVMKDASGNNLFLTTSRDGQFQARSWTGELKWEQPLRATYYSHISAPDLDNDGQAELIATTPHNRLNVFKFDTDGTAKKQFDIEHLSITGFSPLCYDIMGNGQSCLIAPGSNAEGKLTLRAVTGTNEILWESPLDVPAEALNSIVMNAGEFLPGPSSAIAISIADRKNVRQGTFLLDGKTGQQVWFKERYHDGKISMPFRMKGTPTVFDFDQDGLEDIGMDILSYMAFLRGQDGSFAYVLPTPNIRMDNVTYAGHLYNSYLPLFKSPAAKKPHWLVPDGYGSIGLMHPDPRTGIWKEKLDYDMPQRVGLIDVDQDGELEVGYAVRNQKQFICRNLWTGKTEWELELPYAPNSPVITADVDGDGEGEFLTSGLCIGTDNTGQGELRWQSPVVLNWAVIADFDGDGFGEIAAPGSGKISLLKADKLKP